VLCEARKALQLQFVHLGTCVLNSGDADEPPNGQTLWGGLSVDGTAGVAWGWVEIQQGVFAVADPFSLVTNLQLVGGRGEMLSGYEVTWRLNAIVHALPWQKALQQTLRKAEDLADLAEPSPSDQPGRSISTWGMPSSR
jgi:hypothetical protein